MRALNRSTVGPLFAALAICVAAAAIALSSPALAEGWAPVASERLMRLPGESLEKAIENDFAKSALAQEMTGVEEQVAFKQMTLGDLQQAVEREDDPERRIDLQYQFLEAKRDYLALVQAQQALRKQRTETKIRLYEKLMDRFTRGERAKSPEQAVLIDWQRQARDRMERAVPTVDSALLAATAAGSSKYSAEYRKNLAAIEELVAAIQNHPMNRPASIEGQPVSRGEYLRQLLADAQGDLAIVEQESVLLGHMAKLVSLDALALAEGIEETEATSALSTAPAPGQGPADMIGFFTTN